MTDLSRNPLKIRASLGHGEWVKCDTEGSQSLKDQGKSRTCGYLCHLRKARGRNPLKIRASLGRTELLALNGR